MAIEQLGEGHIEAMVECLEEDVDQNLFLLSLLETSSTPYITWYGVTQDDEVRAVVMVLPGRLAVPWAPDLRLAASLGRHLAALHPPSMMVGPRQAVDHIWAEWGVGVRTQCYYDQRLYVCRERPPSADPAFRLAQSADWPIISPRAAAMEREDLGHDPLAIDRALHERVVRDRIDQGKTMVLEEADELLFQLNLGTSSHYGCQVGGTWVPPELRGRGIATRGMRACTYELLGSHPVVTLHVHERNAPAVRCYERSGFVRNAPFRLLTLAPKV